MKRTVTSAGSLVAALLCLSSGSVAFSASTATLPRATASARLAAQNKLFEEQYQSDLQLHPQTATAYGDYRYNDRLGEVSPAALAAEQVRDQQFLSRLRVISTVGFAEQDELSHQVMQWMLQQRIDDYRFKEQEMPVSQMDGPHLTLADLPLSVPLDSVKHYEDYIARLHQIPRVFQQTEQMLEAGRRDHLMPVRFLLDKVPAQCQGVVNADPFLRPLQHFPESITADDRTRLTQQINEAVEKEVLPAYVAFGRFVATEYAPYGRTSLAVTSLPGGMARYRNDIRSRTSSTRLSPEQIHQTGLQEIQRIETEMLQIAKSQGFDDLNAYRNELDTNPKYRPTSADQILEDYRRYIGQMRPKLTELFGVIPSSPVTVEAIPDFQSAMATHYVTGTPDGSRPGRVVVATSDFTHRSLITDEAIAYHEGIPGHHMQLSVAQQLSGLPTFREHVHNSGYIEGWALYAEQLGKEVGFYQDPASDFGRLNSELFRAVRLVVDTGIHSQGWSRDQVVAFFREHRPVDEPTIQAETDRYIAWPAQALSYKLGQLEFRELRARAQQQLGASFDLRRFHDEMLNSGVLPLNLLESRTDAWIAHERATPAAATASYPDRPIHLVVPYPAGGGADHWARLVAAKLSEQLHQPMLVDNVPGRGGNNGTAVAAKAKPDGYTLLLGSVGPLTVHQYTYASLPFDPEKDFVPIALLESSPILLVAGAPVPVSTAMELIQLARDKPGEVSYASNGNGSPEQVAGEVFKTRLKIDLHHLPYDGAGPARKAVLAHQADLMFDPCKGALPAIRQGLQRPLAVAASSRLPNLQQVPTFAEVGVAGYELRVWTGILAPAGTPAPIVTTLNKAVLAAVQSPDLNKEIEDEDGEAGSLAPAGFAAYIQAERRHWKPLVQESGVARIVTE